MNFIKINKFAFLTFSCLVIYFLLAFLSIYVFLEYFSFLNPNTLNLYSENNFLLFLQKPVLFIIAIIICFVIEGYILKWENIRDEIKNFDIIVNATSLGLKKGKDFEFNFDGTKESLIFVDTIYNPLETKTLKYLKDNNRKVFNGLEMFIYQGQKSFYLWNKINPEIDQKLIDLLISKLR